MPSVKSGSTSWARARAFAALSALLVVAGCAALPSSGPTGAQIQKGASTPDTVDGIRVVELTGAQALPAEPAPPQVFAPDYAPPPTDLLGAGDVLEIAIYEAGVTLFGGGAAAPEAIAKAGVSSSAQVERLPQMRIDDRGNIRLPYAGTVRAAGLTVSQLEAAIRRSLHGFSQNPQVVVTIREGITNSVIVGGEVARPGRLVLPTNRETLSEVIALAGGYRGESKDIAVRVVRRNEEFQFRLNDVIGGEGQDMRIFPGDRLTVMRMPRTYSVMGSAGRVEQIAFSGSRVTLAEAIATAGGSHPNFGDPSAIFLFRYVPQEGGTEIPVVYHVNMMKTGSFFLSQRFALRDKDVIYVANAPANQPSKLVQIISQLFAPIVSVQSVVQATGN